MSILGEVRLIFVHKLMNMGTKSICKNLGNNLEDATEETNRPELIKKRSPLFLWNESHQSIVKTTEVHHAIVEMVEQEENIKLNNIPKSPSGPGAFSAPRPKTASLISSSLKGPSMSWEGLSNLDKEHPN